jgi:hypothetical protein
MIVLIDTDVLIDVALDRRPFAGPAGQLLDALQERRTDAYVAWHSLSNFYYMVAPKKGPPGGKTSTNHNRSPIKSLATIIYRGVDQHCKTSPHCSPRALTHWNYLRRAITTAGA